MRIVLIILFGVLPATLFSLFLLPGLFIAAYGLVENPNVAVAIHFVWGSVGLLGTVALSSSIIRNFGAPTKVGLILGVMAILPIVLGIETQFVPTATPTFRLLATFPLVVAIGALMESVTSATSGRKKSANGEQDI